MREWTDRLLLCILAARRIEIPLAFGAAVCHAISRSLPRCHSRSSFLTCSGPVMEDATYIWATSADSTGMVGDQKGYVLCDYMDLWNRERKVNYNLELKWREM